MNLFKKVVEIIKYKLAIIDDDLIVFSSFGGKYADSPKVLSEAIHSIDSSKKIVWLVNNELNSSIPSYVKQIKYGSKKANKYYSKARGIIDNVYCGHEYYTDGHSIASKIKFKIGTFIRYKKNQRYYTTWHGTMLKKIGADSLRNKSYNFSCPNTTMFLDNEFAVSVLRRITRGAISIKLLGEPRNDVLLNTEIDKREIKKKLGIPVNKKVIIYAPTFRSNDNETKNIKNSGIRQMEELDINKLLSTLEKRFGGEWVFVARFHYHVEKAINWGELECSSNGRIINGNKSEDIMEYLTCCDALITDASSCVYDFSLTNKPAFLYFPDYNHYSGEERGLYFEKDELPWSMSETSNKLYESIELFDEKRYKASIDHFYKKLGYVNKKPCAHIIAKYILKDLGQ